MGSRPDSTTVEQFAQPLLKFLPDPTPALLLSCLQLGQLDTLVAFVAGWRSGGNGESSAGME